MITSERWIPVTERLPEMEDPDCNGNPKRFSRFVLVTEVYKDGYVYVGDDICCADGSWLSEVPGEDGTPDCRVIAWMPLPEPYRPEGSRDENKT